MDNPLTAMMLLTVASSGGWFANLSDNKKGFTALAAAVVVGFAIGTATVAQVGLPQRVEVLERKVGILEELNVDAVAERNYILDLIEWQTCAIEAASEDVPLHPSCGQAPIRRNR
jgi:hypothetical protein